MREGRIQQIARRFRSTASANKFVAGFIGRAAMNFV